MSLRMAASLICGYGDHRRCEFDGCSCECHADE
jgi:hypothetical protein